MPDIAVLGGDASGLTGRFFIEGARLVSRRIGILLEVGYWTVLSGKHESESFSDGGRVYARIGVLFTPAFANQARD